MVHSIWILSVLYLISSIITITPYILLFYSAYTIPLDPSCCLSVVIRNTIFILNTVTTVTILVFRLILLHYFLTIQANIASSWSPYTHVSALHWYYDYYSFFYCINVYIHINYFIFVEYYIQNNTGWMLVIVLHLVDRLV